MKIFGFGAGAAGPSNQPALSPSPGNNVNSGNQGFMTIIVSAATVVVVAVIGAAALMVVKKRNSGNPEK